MAYFTNASSTIGNSIDYFDFYGTSFTSTGSSIGTDAYNQYNNISFIGFIGGTCNDYFNSFRQIQEQPNRHQEQPRQVPRIISLKRNPEEINAKRKARDLAIKLLLEYLDPDNKLRYIEDRPIEINSKLFGDIKYQIPVSSKYDKISAIKDEKIVSKLCLIVKEFDKIPLEDVILTKFLYVMHDEENVLKTANHTSIIENLLNRAEQLKLCCH